MRNTKFFAGTALLAALVLTGCSTGGGTADSGSNSGSSSDGGTTATTPADGGDAGANESGSGESDAAVPGDCPELKEGATFDAKEVATCGMPAIEATAGYASTSDVMGMKTEAKLNPASNDMAMTSDMGEVVVVGGKTYVKIPGGDWQLGDPESDNPIVAGLSSAGDTLESLNPAKMAEAIAGDVTVTGTDTRLGQDVFVAEGKLEAAGSSIEVTYYLTKNWVPLETKMVTNTGGQELPMTVVITEWDKKQDIVAPM